MVASRTSGSLLNASDTTIQPHTGQRAKYDLNQLHKFLEVVGRFSPNRMVRLPATCHPLPARKDTIQINLLLNLLVSIIANQPHIRLFTYRWPATT